MFNNSLKIQILQEVSSCSYQMIMRDFIVSQILEIYSYKDINKSPRLFKKQIGNDLILMILLLLKVPFKTQTFDISIQILLTKNYPNEPPQFFLEPVQGIGINPRNTDIDQNTRRILTQSLKYWNPNIQITRILEEIRQSFIKSFPIFKLTPNSSQIMPQANPVYNVAPQRPQVSENVYNNFVHQMGQYFIRGSLYGNQPMIQTGPHPQTIYSKLNIPNRNLYPNQNIQMGLPLNTNPINYTNQSQIPSQNSIIYQQTNIGNQEQKAKDILIREIKDKVEGKIKAENKKKTQEMNKLLNYKSQFTTELNKLNNFMSVDDIKNTFNQDIVNIEQEISNISSYNNSNRGKNLTSNNMLDYIQINQKDSKIIYLLAKEAYLEEMLTLSKKGFVKHNIDLFDAVKFTRHVSREIFTNKFQMEKISSQLYE